MYIIFSLDFSFTHHFNCLTPDKQTAETLFNQIPKEKYFYIKLIELDEYNSIRGFCIDNIADKNVQIIKIYENKAPFH